MNDGQWYALVGLVTAVCSAIIAWGIWGERLMELLSHELLSHRTTADEFADIYNQIFEALVDGDKAMYDEAWDRYSEVLDEQQRCSPKDKQ